MPTAAKKWPSPSAQPRRRGAEADARLHRILHEASRQFLEHGYATASLNEIITFSGGSKATIRKYFGDKAGLFAAVVAEAARQLVESVHLDTLEGSPASVLRTFGERVLEFYLRPAALQAYRGAIAEGHRDRRIAQAFYERGHAQIAAALAARLAVWRERKLIRTRDPHADAERFLHIVRAGLYEKILIGLQDSHTRAEVSAQVEGSVRVFLSGLGG